MATVSAIEPLSRFVRHLFYLAPVSFLRLHRRVNVRFTGRETRPLQNTTMVPTNSVGATLAVARIAGGGKPLPYIHTGGFLLTRRGDL